MKIDEFLPQIKFSNHDQIDVQQFFLTQILILCRDKIISEQHIFVFIKSSDFTVFRWSFLLFMDKKYVRARSFPRMNFEFDDRCL